MCYERGGRSLEREDEKLGKAGGICVWEAAGLTWFCFLMQLLLYKKRLQAGLLLGHPHVA